MGNEKHVLAVMTTHNNMDRFIKPVFAGFSFCLLASLKCR